MSTNEKSKPLGMHLLSGKMHDASDECQFKLMHPIKSYSKDDASHFHTYALTH